MIKTILGDIDFIESLRGKKATFLLSLAHTKTNEIPGITQAGIPGLLHLTPTLDSEFVSVGDVRSLENIAKTPKGVPTPALLTRAVHLQNPFSNIELLNLGLEVKPKVKYFTTYDFDIKPSGKISSGANIDAMDIFQKGVEFAKSYELSSDEYIILAESVPSGTTTAMATAFALNYNVRDKFSSSFSDAPKSIKENIVKKALNNISKDDDIFSILGKVSDNMLIFNSGFILGVDGRFPILLAGGTQMASVLLIINRLLEIMDGEIDSSKFALTTTKWIAEDNSSDIKSLLEMCKFNINSYYSDFNFSSSTHPALKLYDKGEAKEGVGAGGSLIYGFLNGLNQKDIIKQIEKLLI